MTFIRPTGPVTIGKLPGDTGPIIFTSDVFGPSPQWGDDSDLSGAVVSASFESGTDVGYDTFPVAPVVPSTVTDLKLTARVAFTMNPDDPSTEVAINVFAPGMATTLTGELMGSVTLVAPGDIPTVATDVDLSLGPLITSLGLDAVQYAQEVAAWLAAAPRPIYVTAAGTYTPGIILACTVYELALELVGEPAPVPVSLHPVRLYPRDDGLGMSSAPRLHPTPRSGRVFGGHL